MSATAVPIPPTPGSTLAKIWGGVALAVLIGGGLAWWSTADAVQNGSCGPGAFDDAAPSPELLPSGLRIQTVKAGSGKSPGDADITLIKYKGTLTDGTVFDERPQAPMPVAGVIPGFSEALKRMQNGGSYRLCIPAELAYGAQGGGQIPPNSTIRFEVDLMQFMPMVEFEAGMKKLQEQQAKQGGGAAGGIPGGMPGGIPGDPHGGAVGTPPVN